MTNSELVKFLYEYRNDEEVYIDIPEKGLVRLVKVVDGTSELGIILEGEYQG